MSQHLVGIKTEIWFKVVYNGGTGRHEKHTLVVESYLWATKGWRVGRRYKKKEIIPWNKIHRYSGYSVRFK